MGVNLKSIIEPEFLEFAHLKGKVIAIDALNSLYQFLSIIRQPDGTPLMDSQGRITSYLSGLMYRTTRLIEYGIHPIYVFDGEPPELKRITLDKRKKTKEHAEAKWLEAKERGDIKAAKKYAGRTSRFTDEMLSDSKRLLEIMGIPHIQAPSEGEAQCTHMCKKGDCWGVGSQDYDVLLFGAPRLVKGLTLSAKFDLSMIDFEKTLKRLDITHSQLVDLAILIGTDFNEGIKGIGPKKALKIIKENRLDEIELDFDIDAVRDIFLKPNVTNEYDLEWKNPNREKLIEMLCEDHEFSRERIEKAASNLENAMQEFTQKSLSSWF